MAEEKEDPARPALKSEKAKEFWENNFGDKTKVTNDVFEKAIETLLETQQTESDEKNDQEYGYHKDSESRRNFLKLMVRVIFWPAEDLTKNSNPGYVDQSCVQFAINTFGPWDLMFQFIDTNLADISRELKPSEFFHGRSTKDKIEENLTNVGDYALRYHEEAGLVLHWAKAAGEDIHIKEEHILRKKFKKSGVVWCWGEQIPVRNGSKTVVHKFKSLGKFLQFMKGQRERGTGMVKIVKPFMFGSDYDNYTGTSSSDIIRKDSGSLDQAVGEALDYIDDS